MMPILASPLGGCVCLPWLSRMTTGQGSPMEHPNAPDLYGTWWSPLELSHLVDVTGGPCLCRKGLTQQAWGAQTLLIPKKGLSSRLALGWLLVGEL